MRWISVWATISVLLFIFGSSRTAPSSAPVVKLAAYHIVKKPIHTVSDKFLSFTADPNSIARVAECSTKDSNTTLTMAKGLTPAYFRIAGVDSNRLVFQSNPNANPSNVISKPKIFPVTNSDWLKWNNFLSEAGMKVIACVSGETEPSSKSWDLSNTLELITFSDKHNISLDWQLGYELQKLVSPQGKSMGRDVEKLRKILDVFPRYRESLIIGPDMTNFRTQADAAFVRNYLTEAKDSLNVFTWHPFSRSSEDGEILEMLSNGMTSMDNYLWIKDGLMKSSSKGVVPRKPIWIAESESTETVSNLSDSMTWVMRMGSAAKLGASVYLRRPHLLSFYEPTPEYWTAILYKSLVGRTVLDMKQTSGNGTTKLQMFTHCTKFIEKPEESIINPEISYDPGSITVYGVNMALESTRISFKIGYKADETAHLYILTEDASGNFPKTLLNKQPLNLSPENELPIISPRVRESPKYLLIPARSIFFVIFPNTKCRSCNEFDMPDASKAKIKIPEEEDPDTNTNTFTSAPLEVTEDENDYDNVYVNFPKHNENSQMSADFNPSSENSNFKLGTKFVISSDDTWMNRFPEEMKDAMRKEKDPLSDFKDKERAQQYRLLAQAMTGKRAIQNTPVDLIKSENPATRFVYDEEHSELVQSKRAVKNFGRFRRSSESVAENEAETKEFTLENDPQRKEDIVESSSESVLVNGTESKEVVSESNPQTKEEIVESSSESVLVKGTESKELASESDPQAKELNVKSSSESVPVNETASKELALQSDPQTKEIIDEEGLVPNDEETSTPISKLPMEMDGQDFALYLFDQPDNETNSNETEKPRPLSEIFVVPLYKENLEEAMNSSEFRNAVPVITFVRKSTLEAIIEAAKDRVKRETQMENSTLSESLSLSGNNLTKTSSPQNSTMESGDIEGTILEIIEQVAKLATNFYVLNLMPRNGTFNLMNRTQLYNHIFSQAMLNKGKFSNLPKKFSPAENSTSTSVLEENLESDKYKQALKDFERFKRWAESIPASELESRQSSFDDNEEMEHEKNIMKQEEESSNPNLESSMESSMDANLQNMALYVFDQKDGEVHTSQTQKRSTLSQISAIPLDEESFQKAMEENKFRETIPIVSFVPRSTLEKIIEVANNRSKRETTLENSTNSQVSDNLTNSSTSLPPTNSSDGTTTEPITSEAVLKEAKDLSLDIAQKVSRIVEQLIQNETENLSNSTQKPNLQQTNSSVSDLASESDDSKVQRELREVDDDSEIDGNILGSRKHKTIDKPNLRPVSPFPKKPKPAKSKLSKNKGKSSDNVQLNHQDASITSPSETESDLSSKHQRQAEEVTSSTQGKSSNLAETSKSADESGDNLNYDSVTATKLHSEISENLRESTQAMKAPHNEISFNVGVPHLKKSHSEESSQVHLQESAEITKAPPKDISFKVESTHSRMPHSEESSPVKQVPTEDDSSSESGSLTKSNLPAMVGKPLLRPATLADLERERAKHHKPLSQPIKKPKITPQQLRATVEQKRRELLQKHSERLKEIRSLLGLSAVPAPHTYSKRSADVVDDTKEFFSHIWDGVKRWEPSEDWETGKKWIAKESQKISEMVTKRDRRHIDENTTEQLSEHFLEEIFKNGRPRRNSEIMVSPQILRTDTLTSERYQDLFQANREERQQKMLKIVEERKQAMIARGKEARSRHRRDTQKNNEKLKELKDKSRISFNERHQKLAKDLKGLKDKITGRIAHRNKRDLQTIKDKLQKLHQNNKYQQHSRFHNKNDPPFSSRHPENHSRLAKNIGPAKPFFIRNKRDVQTVQNKIQELRQKKQERRNSLHKKSEVEHAPSDVHLEPSSNQKPLPTTDKKPEIENSPCNGHLEPSSNQKPLPTSNKNPEIEHSPSNAHLEHSSKQKPLPTSNKNKKTEIENSPLNGHLEPSSNQTPLPTSHKKPEVKHPHSKGPSKHSSQTPLTSTNTSQNKASKIEKPPHQAVKVTPKNLHNSPSVKREKSHHRLPKREVNENQLEEKATSPADLQKDLHFHLFADPELNTPQSMLDGMKYDDLDRLKRSLNDNEIFDADDEAGIKLKNKDPEGYHELKLNKMNNEFVLEPVTSTPQPSIDVKITKGNSRFQTYQIRATASSQENQTCQLSYNVLKYFWCLTERLWNTYIKV